MLRRQHEVSILLCHHFILKYILHYVIERSQTSYTPCAITVEIASILILLARSIGNSDFESPLYFASPLKEYQLPNKESCHICTRNYPCFLLPSNNALFDR